MKKNRLLIRADSSEVIGSGHIMRCIAIAQSWIFTGGEVTFCCKVISQKLRKRLITEGFNVYMISESDIEIGSVQDGKCLRLLSEELNADTVIIDGYHFGEEFQKELSKRESTFIVLDDFVHSSFYYADIVINRSLKALDYDYSNKLPKTQLLLGPEYTFLRREFKKYSDLKKKISENPRNIMVTFGGADPQNATSLVVDALNVIKELRLNIKILIGSDNPHLNTIKQKSVCSHHEIEIIKDQKDVSVVMNWADMAITAGGTTMNELLFMGVPSISIKTAPNQRALPLYDEVYNATWYVGEISNMSNYILSNYTLKLLKNRKARRLMSDNGMKLIKYREFRDIVKI
ncbi:UDP-2,4-diacetamido-2,4,6-trideoxy-beta-L-altropyranose hydrolase [Salibacterium salarium]|uniref:UDP-2,4-diacetamido-2,4, 6-trideoxy-beta-L-altropyranose hydrolase n=1 Tax=Salibacterium salarium TaxID=284579 RepID=UPI00163B03C3|nr:UDP-2,4-diacetamido-2,4,6-trideoxy-beta-L-altropyranose hydrolase [Salibacterium salarium]